jgi:hypothetical protein
VDLAEAALVSVAGLVRENVDAADRVANVFMCSPSVASGRCDVGLTGRVVANSVASHQA